MNLMASIAALDPSLSALVWLMYPLSSEWPNCMRPKPFLTISLGALLPSIPK